MGQKLRYLFALILGALVGATFQYCFSTPIDLWFSNRNDLLFLIMKQRVTNYGRSAVHATLEDAKQEYRNSPGETAQVPENDEKFWAELENDSSDQLSLLLKEHEYKIFQLLPDEGLRTELICDRAVKETENKYLDQRAAELDKRLNTQIKEFVAQYKVNWAKLHPLKAGL